ncbi:FGGY family carbohydrate kinase [Frigidibacter sp.]|uniref:FGGY family carbohydrate kinase n=1 Tax=Frigidibacter sp. TaxID=2586418 RepID=UPI002732CB47|nr:FGGY family carbohydrate kinase [Frigidibacter sp.]MDP3340028.1 FGGY family carbohydrate kinase [Frigidibacter sp.]
MILALDQGTTSTRALIVDAGGRARTLLSRPHRQIYPRPGWVEHDPEELIANLAACIAAAGAEAPLAAGLANQGESCLAWEAGTGRPISPVIVWQDARTEDICARLRAEGAEVLTLAVAGLPLDPYFSASKLGWLLRELPEARALAAAGRLRLGTTDAFFLERLTGRFVTDITTASRTSLMNLERGEWDADLCALFGVPVECLPQIVPSLGVFGTLPGGLTLNASLVDQQAALYGHGCRAPGDAKITFGTGAFALAVTGALLRPGVGGPLPTVAWQKVGAAPVHALEGGVYCASSAVNWARGLGLFSEFREIADFAAPPALDRGLAFVPALSGLACPHWNRAARGAWLGLGLDTSPADMMQALLEGVALRSAEVIAAMDRVQPVGSPVSIDGGMSANDYFCQFLADVLTREVIASDEPELTAVGIAALAAEGAGVPITARRSGRTASPRADAAALLPARRARFAAARAAVEGYAAS